MAENQPKSGKRLKQKTIPSFLGDVGLMSQNLWLITWNAIFSGSKKWHFVCPNENSFATFISPTSPKNDGIAFGFKRLPLLGGFWAYFQICLFSPCILHYEHKKIRSTISVHFSDQTKKAKLPEMAKLTRIQPVPVMGSNLCQNVSPYWISRSPKLSRQCCSPQGRGGTPCSPCDEHSVIGIVNDGSWEPEDRGRKSLKAEQVLLHSQDLKSRTLGDVRMDAWYLESDVKRELLPPCCHSSSAPAPARSESLLVSLW